MQDRTDEVEEMDPGTFSDSALGKSRSRHRSRRIKVTFLSGCLLIGTAITLRFWEGDGWEYFVALLLATYFLLRSWVNFRVPDRSAEDLLDWDPGEPPVSSSEVSDHVEKAGLLRGEETILATFDESLLDNGMVGSVLTSERWFFYRDEEVLFESPTREIEKIRFRRMWFPRMPFFGRGRVVLLRGTIETSPGRRHSFRWSVPKKDVDPLVRAILSSLGDRVEMLRTLPGL